MKRERARMLVEEYPLLVVANGYYDEAMRAAKAEFECRFMALGVGRGKRAVA